MDAYPAAAGPVSGVWVPTLTEVSVTPGLLSSESASLGLLQAARPTAATAAAASRAVGRWMAGRARDVIVSPLP